MREDVRRWTARRSYRSDSWTAAQLAREKAGTRVSVVLPARDEAATVGLIVTAIREALVDAVPLVDEIVVLDSHSADDTTAVARRAGAVVHHQADVLPELGDRTGKGEALWKALHVTTGDVVAYVDADLRDFDPQFVVGLLGPLLTDPGVDFVKAFYDRPLHSGDVVLPAGGGRVTELVARPLLNLHWPVLAGVVQPLAGEYAARRGLLEQIPFVAGYGVEIAMLVDVVERDGLGAMAQVDLGVRRHRNSDIDALGRMGAQVHLALLSRLERHGRIVLAEEVSPLLTQFVRDGEGFRPVTTDVSVGERPPMATVAAYQRRTRAPA
ncbi:glucosyl-3-phosphoglycerate synthase [Marmoricola sp. Leaf446]|uniref:glucosyl-3-phosphoglycerate synthase n=1 Tax=Marmoricola sp. Leaf446 TaxID=1736379 RepID=UPI0006F903BD|nr:glucosyl-3-phosphoglycerate synthase [Marmoricola sp. Leaf446]KQT94238.1 glucosyl-3-phosphoglycerate synthase [Marmoricola sp. Leaf446]